MTKVFPILEYPQKIAPSASPPHLSKAMNADSIVDLAIIVYFENFQDTAALASVKTYPPVDFESFTSNIQFASIYPYCATH